MDFDNVLADEGSGADGDSRDEGDGFGSVACSICLETVVKNGDRAWANLQCDNYQTQQLPVHDQKLNITFDLASDDWLHELSKNHLSRIFHLLSTQLHYLWNTFLGFHRAMRPMNQNAFDYACEKAEVDLIFIDFTDKMLFRLKHPMVKAAIQRGIYFEIKYSDLLMDAQTRRQVISKFLLLLG
ncbi:polymerase/histidinol phosphatase-like [Arabidopsis suecica]|uniref:Polymerase/histidinol phosphatase-like n=1 Tax=Arabidopsis suecica TaxID=45249 RepID=A0A8T1YP24_ARASU|nr:polymerase/histidinol phosphatase-like [Arabidopsis suecica]